jgi:Flp pilus assembly protein TadB
VDEKDSELRGKLAKEGRLWGLALVCATVGAVTVALTDSVPIGVVAFLLVIAVLGPLLHRYEKRRRQR